MTERWVTALEALGIPCTILPEPTTLQIEMALPDHNILILQAHGGWKSATIDFSWPLRATQVALRTKDNPLLFTYLEVCNGLEDSDDAQSWGHNLTLGGGVVVGHETDHDKGPIGDFWQKVCEWLVAGKTVGEAFDYAEGLYPQFPCTVLRGNRDVRLIGTPVPTPILDPIPTPEPTSEPTPDDRIEVPTFEEVFERLDQSHAFYNFKVDLAEDIEAWLESKRVER